MAEKTSEKTVCMATYSTPVAQAAENRARREILPASNHRGGPDHGAGGGRRGGEQMADVGGGLAVQARGPGQRAGRRPAGQRTDHDEEREQGEQQRGSEHHAPVDEVDRVQPAPHVFSQRSGIFLVAPLRGPAGLPDAGPSGRYVCQPRPRPLARPAGELA
ncbi:MAG TPA: hypothetical protein VMU95_02910 [Trebonia sp.]|nr:hypothetical protein [Trebonia sp.]